LLIISPLIAPPPIEAEASDPTKYGTKVEVTGTLLAPICPGSRERHMLSA
jgi:hypothetical protein